MTEQKKLTCLLLCCAMIMAVWSCNKNGDDRPVTIPTANLNVINAVTDIRAIDYYLNGTRQNINSAIYLYNASGYTAVSYGEQQYQFKSDTDRTLLTDVKLNLAKADSNYTLVLTGQQRKQNLTPIFLSDQFLPDTPASVSNMAKVRFVQASPGTQVYDVFVGDTLSFKNQAFKSTTVFFTVGPGKKTVKINLAGTTTAVFTGTIILNQARHYTMFSSGEQGGTGKNAFTISANISR